MSAIAPPRNLGRRNAPRTPIGRILIHLILAGGSLIMLTPFFWRYDLTEGRLVRPFRETSSRGWGYWLVCPEHRRHVPKIKRFCEWLLPTARADHEAAAAAGLYEEPKAA